MINYFGSKFFCMVFGWLLMAYPSFGAHPMDLCIPDTLSQPRASLDLEEVVVTATRTPRAWKDVPVMTRVITSREIQQTAPLTLIDVLQAELPGLEFTRTEGVANSLTYQGLGANYLLILVDGERLAGETSRSNPDFNRIDVDNIERIEIVKGAMSTLYGSGAVGGVINIITKRPEQHFSTSLQGQYDSEGEQKVRLSAGVNRLKWEGQTTVLSRFKQAYRTCAREPLKHYYIDGAVENSDSLPMELEIEGYRNLTAEQKMAYRPFTGLELRGTSSFYLHERYNAGMVGELKHDLYQDWNAVASADYQLPWKGTVMLRYHYDRYQKSDRYLKLHESELNYRDQLHQFRVLYSAELFPCHELVAAVEWLQEHLRTYQFDGKSHSTAQGAAYVQDDYQLGAHLSLQAALRVDYYTENRSAYLTPKLSAMWQQDGWNLRAGYAAGFRSPTLKELYTVWDHQGIFELMGNPNLKPERSHNLSASVEYTKRFFSGSLNLYRHRIRDKISTIWNLAQDTSYYSNMDKATLSGLDLTLRFQIAHHWTLKGGYAYVRDRQLLNGYNTSSTRPHSANLQGEYRFDCGQTRCSMMLNGRYLGRVVLFSQDEVSDRYYAVHYPAYMMWRFSAAALFPRKISVQVGVNNLLNYRPRVITYNAGITRGITFFVGINLPLDTLYK